MQLTISLLLPLLSLLSLTTAIPSPHGGTYPHIAPRQNSTATGNSTAGGSGSLKTEMCGSFLYFPAVYKCYDDSKLCPIYGDGNATVPCGDGQDYQCYLETDSTCEDGTVTPIAGTGIAAGAAAATGMARLRY